MLKKYSILAFLFFAYTLVLGHSIVPHHHHHDDFETEQQAHHDADDDDHDHDKGDSDLAHGFENYLHTGTTADIHQQSNSILLVSPAIISTIFAVFNFELRPIELPPPLRRPNNDYFPKLFYYLSSKGFRAPPFDLV
ncbi:MAG: hypothetical protein JNJ40_18350 [Bacteroidia bacterium]|nr:hypothetical protein [Bacteroidia bacterium]